MQNIETCGASLSNYSGIFSIKKFQTSIPRNQDRKSWRGISGISIQFKFGNIIGEIAKASTIKIGNRDLKNFKRSIVNAPSQATTRVLLSAFLNFMHGKCDIGISRIPETRLLFVPPPVPLLRSFLPVCHPCVQTELTDIRVEYITALKPFG